MNLNNYNIDIPNVLPQCRFWMIRTKGGHFYDEFLKNGYIAIGLNFINKSNLNQSFTNEQEKF